MCLKHVISTFFCDFFCIRIQFDEEKHYPAFFCICHGIEGFFIPLLHQSSQFIVRTLVRSHYLHSYIAAAVCHYFYIHRQHIKAAKMFFRN